MTVATVFMESYKHATKNKAIGGGGNKSDTLRIEEEVKCPRVDLKDDELVLAGRRAEEQHSVGLQRTKRQSNSCQSNHITQLTQQSQRSAIHICCRRHFREE